MSHFADDATLIERIAGRALRSGWSAPELVNGNCCKVRRTMEIGPSEKANTTAFQALWEARSPLEYSRADCGGPNSSGLLSLNFYSFATSNGDFETETRAIEIFLVRSSAKVDARQDVIAVPLFKGTVALKFEQFEGGMPVPTDPAGGARMALRTRVTADAGGDKWSILVGLMLTIQNQF